MSGKTIKNRIYSGAFILLFSLSPCFAQVKTKDIVIGTSYSFAAKDIEGTIEVSVHLPPGYEASGEIYPVLYLLDIEQDFIFGSGVADFLAGNERTPEMIVIGVFLGKASGPPPALIAFLENELFPFVEKNYRVQPCRILYGHSARSFATLYVLLNRPDSFLWLYLRGLWADVSTLDDGHRPGEAFRHQTCPNEVLEKILVFCPWKRAAFFLRSPEIYGHRYGQGAQGPGLAL